MAEVEQPEMTQNTLDEKLWSIAASHNKPTMGLESIDQLDEYERMRIVEEEQVVLKRNITVIHTS